MSMDLMVRAMKTKVGNPLRKLVLIKLADNASDKGECWPSYQHIAEQCEVSKRSVVAHINALCQMGLIRKEYRSGPKGNASNIYHLQLDGAADALGGSAGDSISAGAGDSSPPGAADSPCGVANASGSAGDSLPPVAGAAPRISHSFEPVIESVTNPSRPETSSPDDLPVDNPDQFLASYPNAVVYSEKKRHWGSHEDLKCAEWIWGQITRLYEQAAETDGELAKPKEPNWAAWANDVRLMCSQDQRTHRQICQLFRRVQGDPFWCRNILSPAKLREKWDELVLRLGPVQRSVTDVSPVDYATPEGFRGY